MNTRPSLVVALLGVAGTVLFAGLSYRYAAENRALRASPVAPGAGGGADLVKLHKQATDSARELRDARAELKSWKDAAQAASHNLEAMRSGKPSPAPAADATSPEFRRDLLKAIVAVDDNSRWEKLQKMGLRMTNEDYRDALAALTGSDWKATSEMQKILQQWSRDDPAAAAEYVATLSGDKNKYMQAVSTLIGAWAKKDPDAASAWLNSLPAGQIKDQALRQYVFSVAATNPEKAAALYATFKDDSLRLSVSSTIASSWAAKDLPAASAWVRSLPEGRARDFAVQQIVTQMAKSDPEGAMRWAETVQDDNVLSSLMSTIAREWAAKDPVAAARWLKTLPDGRPKDYAIQQFAQSIVRQNPEMALQWGETITDENVQRSALMSIASQWLLTDRVAAEKWILSSKLPDSSKQSLTNRVGRGGAFTSGAPWTGGEGMSGGYNGIIRQ
jgi:hypothetical protein